MSEVLQVSRVAPLNNKIISGMIRASHVAGGDVAEKACRALWATLAQTGFRKAEVSVGSGDSFGNSSLTRQRHRVAVPRPLMRKAAMARHRIVSPARSPHP